MTPKTTHRRIARNSLRPSCLSLSALLFFILAAATMRAQLPPGTSDASQPPAQKIDPLLTQANEALDKQDYPAALKALTPLAEKNPNSPPILYNLAFTQDALDQPAAEATYRRAIAADPNYFDPHLALGLLLARNGNRTEAHAELLKATTLNHRQSAAESPRLSSPRPARPDLQTRRRQRRASPGPQTLPRDPRRHPFHRRARRGLRRQCRRRSRLPPPAQSRPAEPRRHRRPHPSPSASTKARSGRIPPDRRAGQRSRQPHPQRPTRALYEQQDKPAQALPIAEKLHTTHPDDPAITRLLARLYANNQQYDQAAPLYAKLVAALPRTPSSSTTTPAF